jgi:predicted RNase H-like nuclease (RuvC/YqgF family)
VIKDADMPLRYNERLQEFEQVQSFAPDESQLKHLQNELTRLENRAEEIQAQIDLTEQECLQANATLMGLRGNTELEGIDERVNQILTLERKIELLNSRRSALDTLLSACKDQMKTLPAQIMGYEGAITRENNSQAIEEFLPAFLSAQEAFLESREQLRELLQKDNHFSAKSMDFFSKIELIEGTRNFRFVTVK